MNDSCACRHIIGRGKAVDAWFRGAALAAALLLFAGCGRKEEPAGGSALAPTDWMLQSAYASLETDDFFGAMTFLNRVLAEEPENASALLGLGYCLEGMDYPDAAERYFDRGLALSTPAVADLVHISAFLRMKGELERAAQLVEKTVRRFPGSREAILERAEVHLARGAVDAAAADFRSAIKLNPADVLARINLQYCCERGAPPPPEIIPPLSPAALEPILQEGNQQIARGDYSRAAAFFRVAIDLDPSDVRGYINLKYCSEKGAVFPRDPPPPPPPPAEIETSPNLPDIVLVSIDTLRADRLGCYGNRRPTSPALDAFAREGVLFRRVLSQAPVTAPSHMALFTALLPDINLVRNHGPGFRARANRLSDRIATFPELLRDNGYYTAGVHGGGDVGVELGFARGFDSYRDSFDLLRLAPGTLPRDILAAIRESRKRGKKLFLFVHHYYCHDPYIYGPPETRRRFLTNPVAGLPASLEELSKGGGIVIDAFWKNIDLSRPKHREHVLALYDGGVAVADDLFRQLRELLIREGIYDDALVIVLSDHGEEFYEHGGSRHGRIFTEQLHVPLIIKFPGRLFAGREVPDAIRLLDLFPTVCAWMGLPVLPRAQGVSFLPLLTGTGSYRPPLVSYSEDLARVRLEEGGVSYCREWDADCATPRDRIFNLALDPAEAVNLVSVFPRTVARFRSRAEQIMSEKRSYLDLMLSDRPPSAARDSASDQISPEVMNQLRALGYVK